jgi:hypothetical protein
VYCIPLQCQYPATQTAPASGGSGRASTIGCGGGPLTAIPAEVDTDDPASMTHPPVPAQATHTLAQHAAVRSHATADRFAVALPFFWAMPCPVDRSFSDASDPTPHPHSTMPSVTRNVTERD